MSGIVRTGKIERYNPTYSEYPEKALWNSFLLLSDINYLKQVWKNQDSEDYAIVSTYIKQAHEYYLASQTVSQLTKSVQIYYCFLNLSRATLFILNDCDPTNYHGLCKTTPDENFLNISAEVNNGLFLELVSVFGGIVNKGDSVTMDLMLRNLIEMDSSYTEYFPTHNGIFAPEVVSYLNSFIEIRFIKQEFKKQGKILVMDDIAKNSNLLDDFDLKEDNDQSVILTSKVKFRGDEFKKNAYDLIAKHFEFSIYPDNHYYLKLVDEAKRVPSAPAYFATMFLLSNISRYSAIRIVEFTDNSDKSRLWFINELCDTALRVFPNLLYNKLYDRTVKFTYTR